MKVGIVRPITVWPFPDKAALHAANQHSVKDVVSTWRCACGQMVDDVKIAVNGVKPVSLLWPHRRRVCPRSRIF